MQHYEIVLILHPNQSEQVHATIERYKALVEESEGKIHRYEDWGRRPLAYPINKFYKGYYLLLNVEIGQDVLDQMIQLFKYNDVVMRHLIIKKDHAVQEESPVKKELDNQKSIAPRRYGSNNLRTREPLRNREKYEQPEQKAEAKTGAKTEQASAPEKPKADQQIA